MGLVFFFSTSAQLLFLFWWGVLKGEADISLVTISLSLLSRLEGGGGEKLLLFHPS